MTVTARKELEDFLKWGKMSGLQHNMMYQVTALVSALAEVFVHHERLESLKTKEKPLCPEKKWPFVTQRRRCKTVVFTLTPLTEELCATTKR